jgi:hypothetical protein
MHAEKELIVLNIGACKFHRMKVYHQKLYNIKSSLLMREKIMNAEERAKAIRKFFWGKNAEKNLDAMAIFIEAMGGGKFERRTEKTN